MGGGGGAHLLAGDTCLNHANSSPSEAYQESPAPALLLPLLPGGKFIGMLSLLPVFLVKSRNLFLCRIVSFKNSGHTFEKIHVGWTELVMVGRLLAGNVVSGYKCFLSLLGVNFLYWWFFGGCFFFFLISGRGF